MISISTPTASAMAFHAEGLWAMFLQTSTPNDPHGPIKIEGVDGSQLAKRLLEVQEYSAFELRLIGLAPIEDLEEVDLLLTTFASCHLHHTWFWPCAELLALIAERAQDAITALLVRTHPGGLPEAPLDIEGIAEVLGVSVPTVRRMIKSGQIPYLKLGRIYRFIAADVVASLRRHLVR
jgi:excisionase family DNA binding protein